ncbi:MAG: helix-turn-helix domain-containing protein [Clostridiales bacterium]|nr:helix-turn-helix domain-containing protein [Clostridiales bacterium]
MDTNKKIKSLCREKGITIKQLCDESGINYEALHNMFRCNTSKRISVDIVKKITSYFGVSYDYLMNDDIKFPAYDNENNIAPLLEKIQKLDTKNKYRLEGAADVYLKMQQEERTNGS